MSLKLAVILLSRWMKTLTQVWKIFHKHTTQSLYLYRTLWHCINVGIVTSLSCLFPADWYRTPWRSAGILKTEVCQRREEIKTDAGKPLFSSWNGDRQWISSLMPEDTSLWMRLLKWTKTKAALWAVSAGWWCLAAIIQLQWSCTDGDVSEWARLRKPMAGRFTGKSLQDWILIRFLRRIKMYICVMRVYSVVVSTQRQLINSSSYITMPDSSPPNLACQRFAAINQRANKGSPGLSCLPFSLQTRHLCCTRPPVANREHLSKEINIWIKRRGGGRKV